MGLDYQEEELTLLITLLFDWIEESQPASLYYGNVCLRAAMERYFYFDAIVQPVKLAPLLDVCKEWRSKNKDLKQIALYDRYHALSNQRSLSKKIYGRVIPWLRILGDYYNHQRSMRKPSSSMDKVVNKHKIGFFVINERFVHFFRDIEQQLGHEKKIYFSSHPDSVMVGGDAQKESVFASDKRFNISFSSISLSPKHPLFPVYFRMCFFYQRINAVLQHWLPDVLLFAEGTSHYDELAAQSASQMNIPTVRLQSGRAAILHSGYRNMSFDTMISWGDGFIDRYKSVSPKVNHIACGSPVMDEMVNFKPIKVKCDNKNLVIFTQPVCTGFVSEQDYLILVMLAEHFVKYTDNINILIRMHPADNNPAFHDFADRHTTRVKLVNSPFYSLADVMGSAESAISFASTTLSEAAACGVIPIILKTSEQDGFFPFPEKYGAAIVVQSLDSAIKKINEVMQYPDRFREIRINMRRFSEQFFGPRDGKSKERIIRLIREIANKGVPSG
ncbi:MAG: glycosyltransferase [Methylophaga sp.]|nr:glycosyltransferase [Methylophaga sp.]